MGRQRYPEDPLRRVLAEARRRGFLGPGPLEHHLEHAQGFAQALAVLLPPGATKRELPPLPDGPARPPEFCDLGSGGGLPGLPLLVWRRDLHGTLLDAQRRRTRFLEEAVGELDLGDRATVLTGRVEDLLAGSALGGRFDAVVARSFGPPSIAIELAAHLVRESGSILISEPPGGRRWATDGLVRLGLRQRALSGVNVAVFERVGEPPPLRRWKAMTDRPSVVVTPGL